MDKNIAIKENGLSVLFNIREDGVVEGGTGRMKHMNNRKKR